MYDGFTMFVGKREPDIVVEFIAGDATYSREPRTWLSINDQSLSLDKAELKQLRRALKDAYRQHKGDE